MGNVMKLNVCRYFYEESLHVLQTQQLSEVTIEYSSAGCENCPMHTMQHAKTNQIHSCAWQLAGSAFADYLIERGYSLITPGWVKNWEQALCELTGSSRYDDHQAYVHSVGNICLLDSEIDSEISVNLKQFEEMMQVKLRLFQ